MSELSLGQYPIKMRQIIIIIIIKKNVESESLTKIGKDSINIKKPKKCASRMRPKILKRCLKILVPKL